jgi:predicted nucleotidyltransferase
MTAPRSDCFEAIEATLRKAAPALERRRVPFLLGGSLAVWARGGPESCNDLDLMVHREDAEAALAALEDAGLRGERPPEGWLYKAWDGDVMVDLIFEPTGVTVDDELLERAPETEVHAVRMRVMEPHDVLATKLLAMREHEVDYDSVLEVARTVREQIDWEELRRLTKGSPYAKAFFTLVDELDVSA